MLEKKKLETVLKTLQMQILVVEASKELLTSLNGQFGFIEGLKVLGCIHESIPACDCAAHTCKERDIHQKWNQLFGTKP